jgi:lipopolysaccharide/colanic/teichoic acid biosynthesis glycosyltransferase
MTSVARALNVSYQAIVDVLGKSRKPLKIGVKLTGNNGTVTGPHLAGLQRLRYQLGGGLLMAIMLPYALVWYAQGQHPLSPYETQALAGGAFGFIFGVWLFRGLTSFPGVEASANIISSFSMSFAFVAAGFLIGRYEYSRSLLLSTFILSLFWFYLLYFLGQKQLRQRIGVIPIGPVSPLFAIDRIDWVQMSDADDDVSSLDAIAVDLRRDLPNKWDRRVADYALAGLPVYHFKHLLESLTGRVELEHLSENSFGTLGPSTAWLKIKVLIDRIIAVIALVPLVPFFLIVTIIIRLDSKGPAFFRQERVGYQGESFTVIKFRTMRIDMVGNGAALDAAMTQENDPRITKLGSFLRRTRIDELPQVINVALGQMSWIGPRPEAAVLSHHYEKKIPFYRYRHIVPPGISGWAQVSQGHVTDVDDVREKLQFDFYYIKNFSPWLDLLIVAKTIKTMLTGYGSK